MTGLTKATYGFHTLEKLALNDSVIHRMDPLVKTVITFTYVITVVSFGRYHINGMVPLVFYPIITMALSDTPLKPFLTRLTIALPFGLMAGVGNLFFDRTPAFYIGNIPVSTGMVSLISILLKTIFTVASVLILVATTSMTELSRRLLRFKSASLPVLLLSMIYRYISVALEETINMYTAYKLRAPGCNGVKMKDMGSFVGQLILRSSDRADRVYNAMKCRGYNGGNTQSPPPKVSVVKWIPALFLCPTFVLLRIFDIAYIIGNLFS